MKFVYQAYSWLTLKQACVRHDYVIGWVAVQYHWILDESVP